jgi:hypothetical protein
MSQPITQTNSSSKRETTGQSTARNRAGRPPFFTEVVRAEICAIVAAGCSYRTAAK